MLTNKNIESLMSLEAPVPLEIITQAKSGQLDAIKDIHENYWQLSIDDFEQGAITQEVANFLVFELDADFFYELDFKFVTQKMIDYLIGLNKSPLGNCPTKFLTLTNIKRTMTTVPERMLWHSSLEEYAVSAVAELWDYVDNIEELPCDLTKLFDYTLTKYPKESFEHFNHRDYNFFSYCSPKAIEKFINSIYFIKSVDIEDLDKTLFDAIFKKDTDVSSFFFVSSVIHVLSLDRGDYSYLVQNIIDNWSKINHVAQKIIAANIRRILKYEEIDKQTKAKWKEVLKLSTKK